MAMLRSTAPRSLLRSLASHPPVRQQFRSQLCTLSARPQQAVKPFAPKTLALVRWQSTGNRRPIDEIDQHTETELGKQKLEAHPELVSSDSSTRGINSEIGVKGAAEDDSDMMGGIWGDLVRIQYTSTIRSR